MLYIKKSIISSAIFLAGTAIFGQSHFTFTPNTGNNMTVLVKNSIAHSIGNELLSPGDEIGVFNPSGLCVGATKWEDKNAAITVWGDNELTPVVDGIKPGEPIVFRIWRVKDNTEHSASFGFSSGSNVYTIDAIAFLSHLEASVEGIKDSALQHISISTLKQNTHTNIDSPDPLPQNSSLPKARTAMDFSNKSKHLLKEIGQCNNSKNVSIISPSDSAKLCTDSTTFIWHASGDSITHYWFELSNNYGMKNAAIDSTLGYSDTIKVVSGLSEGKYWWRVRSGNNGNWGDFDKKRVLLVKLPSIGPGNFSYSWQNGSPSPAEPKIVYTVPAKTIVHFTLYDKSGKAIKMDKEKKDAGIYELTIGSIGLKTGKYAYSLETDYFTINSYIAIVK